jgi:hypothetical protein
MELKTEDFLRDRDTVAAGRLSRRFNNHYVDLDRVNISPRKEGKRGKKFLIAEAVRILHDPEATQREQIFARAVHTLLTKW